MKLIFNEIIVNQLVVDEELFKEYLDSCKENEISPEKDDFVEWLNDNVYIGDLVEDEEFKYTLTESQFDDYLKSFNND
jgi:hypothetical protein